MSIKNYYPALPEIPYKKTSIEMPVVVAFAKSLVEKYGIEIVRTAYCMFRNESANGNSGVNNNYGGIQADVGVWNNLPGNAIATSIKTDGAGDNRRFLCFTDEKGYKISFELMCIKVKERGMFIGAPSVNDPDALAWCYLKKWVSNPKEETPEAVANFKSLYNSATKAIV